MKPKFKSHYDFTDPKQGQRFTQPSQTVPDQTMSIPELIRRYAQGLPLGAPKVPMYTDGEDPMNGINFKKLDLSEQYDTIRSFNNELNETRQRLKNAKQKPLFPTENGENNTNTENLS